MSKAVKKNDELGHLKKEAMIKALEKTLGVVTTACEKVDIARNTHYDWLKSDELYAKKVDELNNVTLDFAESQLYKQIKEGNTAATIFLLKTRGKPRGYIERQEVDHTTKGERISIPPIHWVDSENQD